MIVKTATLPNEDYSLFLEVTKKYNWEIKISKDKKKEIDNHKSTDNFVITDEILAILDKGAATPLHLCLKEEE